jgi:hypothetical protein
MQQKSFCFFRNEPFWLAHHQNKFENLRDSQGLDSQEKTSIS